MLRLGYTGKRLKQKQINRRRPMANPAKFKLTYATMYDPPAELHTRYEEAVDKVKKQLGQEHAMWIDGKELLAKEKQEDRCPIDTNILLGIFQRGSVEDSQKALAAARRATKDWGRRPWQERVKLVRKAADLIDERIFHFRA